MRSPMQMKNSAKTKIQNEAIGRYTCGNNIAYYAATGVGKTRIAIKCLEKYFSCFPDAKVGWYNPQIEGLKGNKLEFEKWFKGRGSVSFHTYASIKSSIDYDLVVFDEGHHVTERIVGLWELNPTEIIFLTATKPEEEDKIALIRDRMSIVDEVNIDLQFSIDNGLVSPFNFHELAIKSSPAEFYKIRACNSLVASSNGAKWAIMRRTQTIYKSETKSIVAKKLVSDLKGRTLIMAGSIKQAEDLCSHFYHSKVKKEHKDDLDKFISGEISVLSCVKALDESVNIPDINNLVVVQVSSKARQMIQRLGRPIRYKPGHVANLYVLYLKDTVDQSWFKNATKDIINAAKTKSYSLRHYRGK